MAAKLSCFDAALKLLARRGYAVKEMAGKLKDKGYPGFEIAATIDRLEDKGWLNDTRFAHDRTRYRAEISRWGAARIRQELQQKGVAPALIDTALSELKDPADPVYDQPHDFQETATTLLNRRFGPLPESMPPPGFAEKQTWLKQREKEKKRRLDFLLRRGFSPQEALNALGEVEALAEEAC